MNTVFLSLGGNQGDRERYLDLAAEAIKSSIGAINVTSSMYETAPWGSDSSSHFLNMVVKVKTAMSPDEVMQQILVIEKKLGRQRSSDQNADRTIDIDILFFDDLVVSTPDLQIPHARLHQRNFVLVPLCEIAGKMIHPVLQQSIEELTMICGDQLDVLKISKE